MKRRGPPGEQNPHTMPPTHPHPARLGSAWPGSARPGPARLLSAPLGSARLSSAWLGPARLGSAQAGLDRLGSARRAESGKHLLPRLLKRHVFIVFFGDMVGIFEEPPSRRGLVGKSRFSFTKVKSQIHWFLWYFERQVMNKFRRGRSRGQARGSLEIISPQASQKAWCFLSFLKSGVCAFVCFFGSLPPKGVWRGGLKDF